MHDLTGFRRDCLMAVALLDKPKGLAVTEWLKDNLGYQKVHHGRLYPNMEKLVDMGLIQKGLKDQRTNEYTLTRRGRQAIIDHANQWVDAAEAANHKDLDAEISPLKNEG